MKIADDPFNGIDKLARKAVKEHHELMEKLRKRVDPFELVMEFHKKFGLVINEKPTIPEGTTILLRERLVREEFEEFIDAWKEDNLKEMLDALCDLIYVIYGTAISYGLPINEGLREVHRSNMSKLGEDGKPVRRNDGKILKGPNFFPPDLVQVLKDAKK